MIGKRRIIKRASIADIINVTPVGICRIDRKYQIESGNALNKELRLGMSSGKNNSITTGINSVVIKNNAEKTKNLATIPLNINPRKPLNKRKIKPLITIPYALNKILNATIPQINNINVDITPLFCSTY